MPGQTFPFTVASGDLKSVGPVAFIAQAVGVDNPTPFYVHFIDAGFGAWVRPFTGGVIVPAPARGRIINVSTVDVPVGSAPSPATSLFASCLAFEDSLSYDSGYSLGGTARTIAFPAQSLPVGTYQFKVPAQNVYKGIVVYIAVTAGAGTVVTSVISVDTSLTGSGQDPLAFTSAIAANAGGGQIQCYPGIIAQTPNGGGPIVRNGAVIGETPIVQVVIAGGSATFEVHYDLLP